MLAHDLFRETAARFALAGRHHAHDRRDVIGIGRAPGRRQRFPLATPTVMIAPTGMLQLQSDQKIARRGREQRDPSGDEDGRFLPWKMMMKSRISVLVSNGGGLATTVMKAMHRASGVPAIDIFCSASEQAL
jgi:hypothetical protein